MDRKRPHRRAAYGSRSASRAVIDASGLVVMPGGIDMHCHIAGPKVNVARKMRPDEKRRGRAVPPHAADP